MRVLVTGGAGFIGANLCRRLVADPAVGKVVVIDDLSTGARSNLDGVDVDLVEASFLDEAMLAKAATRADAIVHLGARPSVPRSVQDPVASHDANATGTMRVLEAARANDAHVIVASSSSVYGANPAIPKHEGLMCMPVSPYAASKLATESYALAHQRTYGLPVLAFRFFNVFGPLQAAGHAYAAVVPAFVDAALRGEPIVVHGDGCQTRDFTFVGTVVDTLARAVTTRITSEAPVNLAFGTRTSLLDVIGIIEDVVGHPIARRHVESRVGDVRDSQADPSRVRKLFPDVSPVPLRSGIEQTVAWMRTTSV
jgi:UDP-glucose 4-epimerase